MSLGLRLAVIEEVIRWTWPKPAYALGIAFIGYAFLSILWGGPQWYAQLYLISLIAWFIGGTLLVDLRWIWIVAAGLLSLNTAIHFAEWQYWIDMPIRNTGLIGNQNMAGSALALTLAAAVVYRLWWFLPIGAYGVYLTQSRGAMLAVGVTGLAALLPKYKVTAFVLAVAAFILIVSLISDIDNGMASRLGVWQDTINHFTIFGRGLGSFFDAYATWPVHINMTMQHPPHVYNDFLELIFEFGLGSIFLWLMAILIVSESQSRERLIILAYGALALTYFPLYIPIVGHLTALTLGHLTRKDT